MGLLQTENDDWQLRYHELRREFQNIVIAHAAVVYQHTSSHQNAEIAVAWKQLIERNGWQHLFQNELPAIAQKQVDSFLD